MGGPPTVLQTTQKNLSGGGGVNMGVINGSYVDFFCLMSIFGKVFRLSRHRTDPGGRAN